MALTKSHSAITNLGTTAEFPDAYIKVDRITGDKLLIEISVNYYTKHGGLLVKTESHKFFPSLEGDNFIAQAYEHLKTLPEFEGAVDC